MLPLKYPKKWNLFLLLFLSAFMTLNAQHAEQVFLSKPKLLNYNNELPKNLLSSRSAVFLSCPFGVPAKGQKGWKEIAIEAHAGFRKSGIDAVAYYHLQDVLAGNDPTKAFADDLKKREIKNVIIIANDYSGSSPKGNYTVIITPFSGDLNIIAHNQAAWKREGEDIKSITEELYRNVSSTGLEKSNYLIIDQPEFFEDTKINKGKRFEIFLSDLKIDMLAVPKFIAEELPEQSPEGLLNQQAREMILKNKEQVHQNNEKLESIMSMYPFKFEFVDQSRTEEQLRRAGFQYVLMRVNTSEKTAKDLLNYLPEKEDAEAKARYKKGVREQPVYKYYIRHIYSGDIYLGSEWDAAATWHEALENHLLNLRRDLKVNQ